MPATLSLLTNIFPDPRSGAGPSACGRRRRRQRRPRARDRRLAARALLLGLGLPRQRAGDRRRPLRRLVPAAVVEGPRRAPPRPGRRRPLDRRPGRAAVGDHRGPRQGLERPGGRWSPSSLGPVVLAAFVVWELHSDHPMLDVRFFKNRRFTAANVAITLVVLRHVRPMFLVTQYLQTVLGYSALAGRPPQLPMALVMLVVAPLAPRLVERFGTKLVVAGRPAHRGRSACCVVATVPVTDGYPHLLVGMSLLGGRHGPRHGPRHGVDHGLAAAGQGRRRLGHERHHPPDGRRPGRRRHRLACSPALPARRHRRSWPRSACRPSARHGPGLHRRRPAGGIAAARRRSASASPSPPSRVRRRHALRPPGRRCAVLASPPSWCSPSCRPGPTTPATTVETPLDGLASLGFAEAESVLAARRRRGAGPARSRPTAAGTDEPKGRSSRSPAVRRPTRRAEPWPPTPHRHQRTKGPGAQPARSPAQRGGRPGDPLGHPRPPGRGRLRRAHHGVGDRPLRACRRPPCTAAGRPSRSWSPPPWRRCTRPSSTSTPARSRRRRRPGPRRRHLDEPPPRRPLPGRRRRPQPQPRVPGGGEREVHRPPRRRDRPGPRAGPRPRRDRQRRARSSAHRRSRRQLRDRPPAPPGLRHGSAAVGRVPAGRRGRRGGVAAALAPTEDGRGG